eukprot:TRINITY_DN6743_c0_g1_i2.p1 TRINITY_DN6743_c0_g1~~TRINITY_DN6743_c0_g1_i2.p1  ORF type:complete len:1319 (+),score=262.68 TRINITY_DN6743_c0_g1_i2:1073-5029(+)
MQALFDKLLGYIRLDIAASSSDQSTVHRAWLHDTFFATKLHYFIGRQNKLEEAIATMEQYRKYEHPPMIIYGPPGVGKSTFMAKLADHFSRNPSNIVISYFVEADATYPTVEDMIKRIYAELFVRLHQSEAASRILESIDWSGADPFAQITALMREEKYHDFSFFLFIDGVNLLAPKNSRDIPHDLRWLPIVLPANISIIVSSSIDETSSLESRALSKRASSYNWPSIVLECLGQDELLDLAKERVSRFSLFSQQVIIEHLKEAEFAGDVVYTLVLLQEATRRPNYETLADKMKSLLECKALSEIISFILGTSWAHSFGDIPVGKVMRLVSVSRIGIADYHIRFYLENESKVKITQQRWDTFIATLSCGLIQEAEGRLRFWHPSIQKSVYMFYVEQDGDQLPIVSEYVSFLERIHGNPENMPDAYIAETCSTYLHAKMFDTLMQYLQSPAVICKLLGGRHRREFFACWAELSKQGFDSQGVYEHLVKEFNDAGRLLHGYYKETNDASLLVPSLKSRLSLHKSHDTRVEDYYYLGWAFGNKGMNAESVVYYRKYLDMVTVDSSNRLKVTHVYHSLASILYSQRKYQDAIQCYRKSMDLHFDAFGSNHPTVASLYDNFGLIHYSSGNYADALDCYANSLELRKGIYGEIHLEIACSHQNLGLVYLNQGSFDLALDHFRQSLAMRSSLLGKSHPDTTALHFNLGQVYERLYSYEDALAEYTTCLDVRSKSLGESHLSLTGVLRKIGQLHQRLGRSEEAEAAFQRILEIQGLKVESGAMKDPCVMFLLAETLMKQQRVEDAIDSYEKGFQMAGRTFGEKPDYGKAHHNAGILYAELSNAEKALEHFSEACKIRAVDLEIDPCIRADSYERLATILASQGQYEAAIDNYEKAVSDWSSVYGRMHLTLADDLASIADAYQKIKRFDQSLLYYKEAIAIRMQLLGEQDASLANLFYSVGAIHLQQAEYDRALLYYFQYIQNIQRHQTEPDLRLAEGFSRASEACMYLKRVSEAVGYFDKAYKIHVQLLGEDHELVANLVSSMAEGFIRLDLYQEAKETLCKLLEIRIRTHGMASDEVAHIYELIGLQNEKMAAWDDALQSYTKSYHVLRLINKDDSLEAAKLLYRLGHLHRYQGSHLEALQQFKRVMGMRLRIVGDADSEMSKVVYDLAVTYRDLEAFKLSLGFFKLFLERVQDKTSSNSPKIAVVHHEMAHVCLVMGRTGDAIEHLKEALAVKKDLYGSESVELVKILSDLSSVYESMQNYTESISILEDIVMILNIDAQEDNVDDAKTPFEERIRIVALKMDAAKEETKQAASARKLPSCVIS